MKEEGFKSSETDQSSAPLRLPDRVLDKALGRLPDENTIGIIQLDPRYDTHLMISYKDDGEMVQSAFGLYDAKGDEVHTDIFGLFNYLHLTYQYMADGLGLTKDDIHNMVGEALKKIKEVEDGN